MVSSRRLLIGVAIGLVVLLPVIALGFLLFPPAFMYDHYSTYSYETSVSTNATVENATFYLPFPTEETGSGTVEDIWIYGEEGTELDWGANVVETDYGPMLQLRADELEGTTSYVLYTYAENGSLVDREEIGPDEIPEDMTNRELVADPTTYQIAWRVTVDRDIETRYPVGNASFLTPANDVTRTDCQDPWSETDTCYTFTSVAGATYKAEGPATLTIGEIRFDGTNEWGFWLSNSFNTFEAATSPAAYTDDRQGWTVIDGQIQAGMGRYDGPSR